MYKTIVRIEMRNKHLSVDMCGTFLPQNITVANWSLDGELAWLPVKSEKQGYKWTDLKNTFLGKVT